MERCPNCGSPARPGAKYCTTCGVHFTGTAHPGAALGDSGEPPPSLETSDSGSNGVAAAAGWPSAPASVDASRTEAWSSETASAVEAASEEPLPEDNAPAWPAPPSESWPEAPVPRVLPDSDQELPGRAAAGILAPTSSEPNAAALARAEQLLTELGETLAEIGRASPADLGGVLSDLEVALPPPEALGGEHLAELRDALFAARERPRDVDTIVDLTRRIDAMVALVIAYDRSIAAIERALPVLRRVLGDR